MENEVNQLTERILKKITPKKEEYAKIDALSRELEQKIKIACQQEGITSIVRVEGSVAKDTWLSENPRHRHFHAVANIDSAQKPR